MKWYNVLDVHAYHAARICVCVRVCMGAVWNRISVLYCAFFCRPGYLSKETVKVEFAHAHKCGNQCCIALSFFQVGMFPSDLLGNCEGQSSDKRCQSTARIHDGGARTAWAIFSDPISVANCWGGDYSRSCVSMVGAPSKVWCALGGI